MTGYIKRIESLPAHALPIGHEHTAVSHTYWVKYDHWLEDESGRWSGGNLAASELEPLDDGAVLR